MAGRKEKYWVADDARDKGKKFLLTEMSAARAERWAMRAFFALANSGVDLPPNIQGAGMAGLAILGLQALMGMDPERVQPLLDEMMECVQIIPSAAAGPRALVEEDIEEVATRIKLKMEVFELHTGFSLADVMSRASKTSVAKTSQDSSSTETSLAPSAQ
jgi:hypothetical protein